jgi:hypothetical protein
MLHYNVNTTCSSFTSYTELHIFLFGICVALKQKISVHITVILIKESYTGLDQLLKVYRFDKS